MRRYMFDHVYTNPKAKNQETKAQNLLRELYEYYMKYTEQMPEEYRATAMFQQISAPGSV